MRLLSPLRRLLGLPRSLVDAILILPGLAKQLGQVRRDTSVMPDIRDELVVVRDTLIAMRGDTEKIAAEMPKLVVLEESLPPMLAVLEELDGGVHQLADVAEPLQGAARRLGRFNDRFPHRNGR